MFSLNPTHKKNLIPVAISLFTVCLFIASGEIEGIYGSIFLYFVLSGIANCICGVMNKVKAHTKQNVV